MPHHSLLLTCQLRWSHHTKRMLIDTLGCAIGGYLSEPSAMARALAVTISSQQPATVLGSGQQTSLELATFANGVMIRYLDFNDGYTSKESGHPSDAIGSFISGRGGTRRRTGVSSPRPYWLTKCSVGSVMRCACAIVALITSLLA